MRKIVLSVAFGAMFWAFGALAQAVSPLSPDQISGQVALSFPSNCVQCITPLSLRNIFNQVIYSYMSLGSAVAGNSVLAGPANGLSGLPTFRALVGGDLGPSGVTPGTYGSGTTVPVVTVNTAGQVTGVTNIAISAPGTGTVTSVTCGTGLTGGTITGAGTCALSTPVGVASGGSGASTLTSHGVLLGNGTSAITATTAPSAGQLLVGQSAAAPAPETLSGDCTLAAGGTITCTKVNGNPLGTSANNVVQLNGSAQLPAVSGALLTNVAYAPGTLYGLTLSNDATTPTTTIDTTSGVTTNSDGSTVQNMTLASAITKTTGAWVVGSTHGCLDTGTVAASSWYHVFIIKNSSGTVDELCSLSPSAPTMPSGYTANRRIGSILTDGSVHIRAFVQTGDHFVWNGTTLDINATVSSASAQTGTLSTPLGVSVLADFSLLATSSAFGNVLVSSVLTADEAPSATVAPLYTIEAESGTGAGNFRGLIQTDTSSHIRYRNSVTSSTTYLGVTYGWLDPRGRS